MCVCDSFGGKLHIGFVDIRNKLEGIQQDRETRRIKRREDEEKVSRDFFSLARSPHTLPNNIIYSQVYQVHGSWGGGEGVRDGGMVD